MTIPFTANQRARVWVAVYRKGSNETGARGPFGAWLRLQPQDLYVWSSSSTDIESGSNSIPWDGRDLEGNAAGPGNYEFDIIGFNVLDKATLAGPSVRTGFGDNTVLATIPSICAPARSGSRNTTARTMRTAATKLAI